MDGEIKMEKLQKKDRKEHYKNRAIIGGIYKITCNGNNNFWIRSTTNMQGSKNRFEFFLSTSSCPETGMIKSWSQFGASSFTFDILEEIKKKETQTEREFSEDVKTLLELWKEKETITE